MNNEVQIWLNSGAEVNEGLRLLNKYTRNKPLAHLVGLNPKYKYLLIKALAPNHSGHTAPKPQRVQKSFRNEWPFIKEPNCPNELKVLASDKLTTYYRYVEAHDELFDCTNNQECYEVAKIVISNFLQNREIYRELEFYKEHNRVLGKHSIFKELSRLKELRKLPLRELIRRQINIKESIWRASSEIAKRDKPYLDDKREESIRAKTAELSEVERFIEQYEKTK